MLSESLKILLISSFVHLGNVAQKPYFGYGVYAINSTILSLLNQQKMKQLLFLVLLNTFQNVALAQCAVTKERGKHSTTYVAKMEKVYTNKDLENGVNQYELRVILNKDDNVLQAPYYMLQCRYLTSGVYRIDECAPRYLVFEFSDGSFKGPVVALTEEEQPTNVSGFTARVFNYELSEEVTKHLLNVKLKFIAFGDKRTGHAVDAAPYPELLKEQLDCLNILSNRE